MTERSNGDRARRARDFFLTESNNCAQSIMRAFADLDEDTEAIEEYLAMFDEESEGDE